jgi:hypothetical protein
MSTQINIAVDSGGLLNRNAQQTSANRQAKLTQDVQAKAGEDGKAEQEKRRLQQGSDRLTGKLLVGNNASRIRRIDQQPAANRQPSSDQWIYDYTSPMLPGLDNYGDIVLIGKFKNGSIILPYWLQSYDGNFSLGTVSPLPVSIKSSTVGRYASSTTTTGSNFAYLDLNGAGQQINFGEFPYTPVQPRRSFAAVSIESFIYLSDPGTESASYLSTSVDLFPDVPQYTEYNGVLSLIATIDFSSSGESVARLNYSRFDGNGLNLESKTAEISVPLQVGWQKINASISRSGLVEVQLNNLTVITYQSAYSLQAARYNVRPYATCGIQIEPGGPPDPEIPSGKELGIGKTRVVFT